MLDQEILVDGFRRDVDAAVMDDAVEQAELDIDFLQVLVPSLHQACLAHQPLGFGVGIGDEDIPADPIALAIRCVALRQHRVRPGIPVRLHLRGSTKERDR